MPSIVAERDLDLVVTEHSDAAEGVVVLSLRRPDSGELPAWTPGSHIDLLLGDSRLTQQYSLCGAVEDRRAWRVAVLRAPERRGGSTFIHSQLVGGTQIAARGPRNHFAFDASQAECVLIAGGIGITPLIRMLAAVEAAGMSGHLHYGGRTRSSMAFLDELARYGGRVRLYPENKVGLLDLDAIMGAAGPGAVVSRCGPTGLLNAAEDGARPLRVEHFSPKQVEEPVWDGTFEVELAQTGVTTTVPPGCSILEVAEEAGVMVVASRQEGTCGMCEMPIIEGNCDSILSDETDIMMICVSRAACPRLVLDL